MSHQPTIEAYEKIAEEFSQRNAQTIYGEEYEIFTKLCRGEKKILEIGCGTGRDAEDLIKRGFDYIGTDASTAMLKMAAERNPTGKFLVMDFYHFDFPDQSFDGFWAAASFLHVPKAEIDQVLQETKRVLKPGAAGFISLKEKTTMDEGIIKEDKAGGINRYFAFYTEEEFKSILERNGYQVAQITKRQETDSAQTKWLCYFVTNA